MVTLNEPWHCHRHFDRVDFVLKNLYIKNQHFLLLHMRIVRPTPLCYYNMHNVKAHIHWMRTMKRKINNYGYGEWYNNNGTSFHKLLWVSFWRLITYVKIRLWRRKIHLESPNWESCVGWDDTCCTQVEKPAFSIVY